MHQGDGLSSWLRGGAGQAVWSASALVVPAVAVLHERQVAQAIALYTCESVLAALILRGRLGRILRPLAFGDPTSMALRRAREVAGLAALVSLVLGVLVLTFSVAYDARPTNLFDVGTWQGAPFAGFGRRLLWMTVGLCLGAALDGWLAPVGEVAWLEATAAWQMRRVAAPALAYLPGAALTAWFGSTAGFVWPWFVVRAFTDLTALRPGERGRVRDEVFGR